jgi:hypothetical protein
MNALYCCCITDVWIDVSKNLQLDCDINPSYFIAWEEDINKLNSVNITPDTFIQTVEDAWKGIGFPRNVQPYSIDEETIKNYSFEINNGIRMIDRLDPLGSHFPFTDRNYWFISLIETWVGIIDHYNLDLIISPSVPHRVFDYALYIASHIRNCKFLMFQMTPFGDKSFIIDDVKSTSNYMKQFINSQIEDKVKCDDTLPNSMKTKIELVRGSYDDAIPDYMVKQNERIKSLNSIPHKFYSTFRKTLLIYKSFTVANTYRVKRYMSPEDSTYNQIQLKFEKIRGGKYKKQLKKAYLQRVKPYNDKSPYVLVALHYQPEETSCPTGGAYAEQRQIIKNLAEIFPENVNILVKEHTTQFHPDFEGEAGRSLSFYKDIEKISNRVFFVSPSLDTFELIDSASATITISGTIGWESVLRGTPTLIFGRAWYEDMPGIFKIKSKKNLLDAVTEILGGYKINDDRVYKYHCLLDNLLISSIHYKAFEGKNISSKAESVVNLTRGISRFLKKLVP